VSFRSSVRLYIDVELCQQNIRSPAKAVTYLTPSCQRLSPIIHKKSPTETFQNLSNPFAIHVTFANEEVKEAVRRSAEQRDVPSSHSLRMGFDGLAAARTRKAFVGPRLASEALARQIQSHGPSAIVRQ
jgi:hypothetical protein